MTRRYGRLGTASPGNIEYWRDESEEPAEVAAMGLSEFNWLAASVMIVAIGIAIAAIRRR